jgi:hypothetical protein
MYGFTTLSALATLGAYRYSPSAQFPRDYLRREGKAVAVIARVWKSSVNKPLAHGLTSRDPFPHSVVATRPDTLRTNPPCGWDPSAHSGESKPKQVRQCMALEHCLHWLHLEPAHLGQVDHPLPALGECKHGDRRQGAQDRHLVVGFQVEKVTAVSHSKSNNVWI